MRSASTPAIAHSDDTAIAGIRPLHPTRNLVRYLLNNEVVCPFCLLWLPFKHLLSGTTCRIGTHLQTGTGNSPSPLSPTCMLPTIHFDSRHPSNSTSSRKKWSERKQRRRQQKISRIASWSHRRTHFLVFRVLQSPALGRKVSRYD